jgi:hypothetical protein
MTHSCVPTSYARLPSPTTDAGVRLRSGSAPDLGPWFREASGKQSDLGRPCLPVQQQLPVRQRRRKVPQ